VNIFDHHYKEYDAWYEKNRWPYLSELEALKKVIPQEGRGLEIGVGTGRFAAPLNIELGIDCSQKMLELAAQRGVNVRWGLGEDLPFLDDSMDYVAIIITICFVADPLKVLREAQRVLDNNGVLVLGIIDKDSFLGQFYQKKKSIFYKEANFFRVQELVALLKQAGFDGFTYYQTLFTFPDKMNSVDKPQEGFGEGGFVAIKARARKDF